MIAYNKITKKYNNHVVLNIPDLKLNENEILGLVGNNGAGKTTLLRITVDLIKPTTGSVTINGYLNNENESWKTFTGSYFNDSFLIDYLTPWEYFEFVGQLYNLSRKKVNHYLSPYEYFLGNEIIENKDKYIRELSSGNRQKIGMVAAMFTNPEILILDEPFAHLDPTSQHRLSRLLLNLNTTHKTSMIISSHNLKHVVDVSSRLVILDEGKIIEDMTNNEQALPKLEGYFARD